MNATLHLFERDGVFDVYLSRMSLVRVFKRGEIFALCNAVLAKTQHGLDARELVEAIVQAKGMDKNDAVLRKALAWSIINVMGAQFRRGKVRDVGRRRGVRVRALA